MNVDLDHPSIKTLLTTAASGTLVLVVMTILLFGVPFALFYFL